MHIKASRVITSKFLEMANIQAYSSLSDPECINIIYLSSCKLSE